MLLAEDLARALESVGGVKVYCDSSLREEVGKVFMKTFESEWEKALEEFEDAYGGYDEVYEEYFPVSIESTEYGLFISVEALSIEDACGCACDLENDALINSFKAIKEQFPTIEYEGFISYVWADKYCSDVNQYRISSSEIENDNKVYDFVGQAIADHLKGDHLWHRWKDLEMENCIFVVTGKLHYFKNREEITGYIENLGGTVSESVSKKTSYVINNDLTSSSAKNKKAKELGIPIISEKEFIFRFGDPEEYKIDGEVDDFWAVLSDRLREAKDVADDFSEIAESLYTYRKWIGHDNMVRALNSMIDIISENDFEIRDSLKETAGKILERI